MEAFSLTVNISIISSSNVTTKDSFGILRRSWQRIDGDINSKREGFRFRVDHFFLSSGVHSKLVLKSIPLDLFISIKSQQAFLMTWTMDKAVGLKWMISNKDWRWNYLVDLFSKSYMNLAGPAYTIFLDTNPYAYIDMQFSD